MGGKRSVETMWNAPGGDYIIVRQAMQARRRAGAPFAEAWAHAMKMVSREDRDVLEQTRGAWECAYHRRPFYSGQSFSMLADNSAEHHDSTARIAV